MWTHYYCVVLTAGTSTAEVRIQECLRPSGKAILISGQSKRLPPCFKHSQRLRSLPRNSRILQPCLARHCDRFSTAHGLKPAAVHRSRSPNIAWFFPASPRSARKPAKESAMHFLNAYTLDCVSKPASGGDQKTFGDRFLFLDRRPLDSVTSRKSPS